MHEILVGYDRTRLTLTRFMALVINVELNRKSDVVKRDEEMKEATTNNINNF